VGRRQRGQGRAGRVRERVRVVDELAGAKVRTGKVGVGVGVGVGFEVEVD